MLSDFVRLSCEFANMADVVWPVIIVAREAIPEIDAEPGDSIHIDPSQNPSVVVGKERPVPRHQVTGFVLALLRSGRAEPVIRSCADVTAGLERCERVLPEPPVRPVQRLLSRLRVVK